MLQLWLLGQFDLQLDRKRITIPSRVGQSLFAYLVTTTGTPHRREKLAGTFWPDTTEESARRNLRQELWRIRKALSAGQDGAGDYLLADEYTIAFNRNSAYWLDVAQLERRDADLESLTSNLALYQGEFLPGFYEDWVVLERERLQSVFDAKMEQLLELLVGSERWTAVQEQAERWLALGSAPEPAFRALMLASGARGDMAKVSAIYQRCLAELDERFGLEPSAETRALYDGLLKGARVPSRGQAARPSGTITFLFTDIESSTTLLDSLGQQYASVLETHHQIMRSAIRNWNGKEVDTQGDSFFVTFARAIDAVECAAEAQRALQSYPWTDGKGPNVRMGLHTGEPLIASTGYVGIDVHRAARIGDSAHGGQVLLSQTTRELVIHDLPRGISIRELGEYRLKDLKYPTPIYQLVVEGLPADFPPVRTKFTGTEAPTPGEPPFKGLQYFDEEDSGLFFGRELLTEKLMERLRESQFLSVIIGASGSGKSSLVRAGLIPALRRAGWNVHVITPTAYPLAALATELTRDIQSVTATATLIDDLMQDPRSLSLFLARQNHKTSTLLVIDQFEELFTLCRDEFEREAFIDNLLSTLHQSRDRFTLVITLRADFYAHLAQYPELRDAVAKHQEYIGPMSMEELRRAIEEPARLGQWAFEPGLVDLILRDVGDEPGALPLLSHALLETWKRRAGHTLTLKGYADAGGVRGAIAHTAESVFQDLSAEEQLMARDIFLRLTELGEGTEDTRRRASFQELMSDPKRTKDVRNVLNVLAEARLVTLSEDTAEVAHEALIREWPTLREWLDQDREGLQFHRRLTEAAHEWELLERDEGVLYRGAQLAQAREWAASHDHEMNVLESAFLQASIEWSERELAEKEAQRQRELDVQRERAEEQARAARQLRRRALFLTGALIVAAVLAITAFLLSQRANQQAQLSSSRELAAAAISSLDVDPERSILLALQAISTANTSEAEDALHQAILTSRLRLTLRGHTEGLTSVAIRPDGTRIATASVDGTTRIWDAATGEEVLTLQAHRDEVWGVAFSPDGSKLLTASLDKTAKIWDAASGELLVTLSGHAEGLTRAAFNPIDGGRAATSSVDGTVKVWDSQTGKEILSLSGQTGRMNSVAFSPDGSLIATAQDEGTAKVWDAESGEELFTLTGHLDIVLAVAFSPDGRSLATADFDGVIKVWDTKRGENLRTFTGHHDSVIYSLAFSPDGSYLATSSSDGTAKVWDAATGVELFTLAGHTGFVFDAAFSPDGTHLITASGDGTARVWDLAPSHELSAFKMNDVISGVAISPDGTQTASAGQRVVIWDMVTGQPLYELKGHTGFVHSVKFSPDGMHLATSSDDLTARLWDLPSGREILALPVGLSGNIAVGYSPDGTRLATTGTEKTVSIWDTLTGKELLTLKGHTAPVVQIAFNSEGTQLATASENAEEGVKIWDATTGKEVLALNEAHGALGIAFSPDGKRLATGSGEGLVALWDLTSGDQLLSLSVHRRAVFAVAFTPDGARLATASSDGTVKIWDLNSGEELLTLFGHSGRVFGVAISPDGTRLATAGQDGISRVYLLNLDELVELAHSRVTRSLTTEECKNYLHIEECPAVP
jgi:WD40 repeat protein/class 3 adenylate cyclase